MPDSSPIGLCVTCVVDQIYPDIGVAAVRLLRHAGYTVNFPSAQTCCGQPFFNSGFKDEAAHLAKRTIRIFEDYEMVVLPSGSCTTMIRAEYPHLLEKWPGWHQRATRLADKTFELSEFLVHRAEWTPAQQSASSVTYHDSCHMCRTLHLRNEPRQLLTGAGYTINEMPESDRCCGFGGLFSVRMPAVANAMTTEKLQQAAGSGGNPLVTADPGCLMQMRGLAEDVGVRVEHLATVLEEATR